MILVFTEVFVPLLDPEIEQVCTGMHRYALKVEECCSAVRLLCAAILKLDSKIGTNELSTLFSPVAHYANIYYDMIDFLGIDRFVLSFALQCKN